MACKSSSPGLTRWSDDYWMVLRHLRRDLSDSDLRRCKVPTKGCPAVYRSLVLPHLSNSYLYSFGTPDADFRSVMKILSALADRNFSVGTLRVYAYQDALFDYHSIDTVFGGGMRLDALELSLYEHQLATLIKATDFFQMSTVRKLKALKLYAVRTRDKHALGTEPICLLLCTRGTHFSCDPAFSKI